MYRSITILIKVNPKQRRVIFGLLTLLWMAIIFWFSGKAGEASSGMSDGVLRFLEQLFQIDIFNQHNEAIELAQTIIRKGAHSFVYFVLALLLWSFIRTYTMKRSAYAITLGLCFLYACSDELHQLFVPGRAGLLSDVLIDTLAASVAILLLFVYHQYQAKHRI